MSKARSMYAGSSGYNYGVNKNSPGNGNGKWQGLWPSVGHARNARLINTRAGGDNRNVVFCMNQLGGVGRISNMFASTADGVHNESCAHSAGSTLGAVLAGSSEIAYDEDLSEPVQLTLLNLHDLAKKTINYGLVIRFQFNRKISEDEISNILTPIVDKIPGVLDSAGNEKIPIVLFNPNTGMAVIDSNQGTYMSGYVNAGYDINCLYIQVPVIDENINSIPSNITIPVPSDIVFIETQLEKPGGATYTGSDYYRFSDYDYPLTRGNLSLLGDGKNVLMKKLTYNVLDYSPVSENWQDGSIYKIDKTTSLLNLSGDTDDDGCSISYILGATATNPAVESFGIPIDNLLPSDYTLIRVRIKKSFFDDNFNPYKDEYVVGNANYMDICFNAFNDAQIENTLYGVSGIDISSLNNDDDDGYYYVYFTTDNTIYSNLAQSSSSDLPPVITVSGEKKGFLLYNNNGADFQLGFLIRIRNGDTTTEPLDSLENAPCYLTPAENQPLTSLNDWVSFQYI